MHFKSTVCAILASLLLAPTWATTEQLALAAPLNYTGPHYVFAHYMVALPPYGPSTTEENLKAEIIRAQQAGIDGFALNCGTWTGDPQYKLKTLLMYQAAKDLGTNFLLFISVDGRFSPAEDEDMMQSTYTQPNQFRYQGKYVISGFGGNVPTQTELNYYTGNGARSVFWIPQFYPTGAYNGQTDQQIADNTLNQSPPADGFFDFLGSSTLQSAYNNTFKAAGKFYMGSANAYYRGLGGPNGAQGNYRLFDTMGFTQMQSDWKEAIADNIPWMEITTWNDYEESTYVDTNPTQWGQNLNGYAGPLPSHRGYLDASQYYIQWYKTGVQPQISTDQLFYFYQTHPKTLQAIMHPGDPTLGQPYSSAGLQDHVYVTLYLSAPAQLTISSGSTNQTYSLPTGIQNIETPFAAGIQHFLLTRNGKTLIDKVGEEQISATDSRNNFNYFSGDATANQSASAPYPLASGSPAARVTYRTSIRTSVDLTIRDHASNTVLYTGSALSDPATHANQVVVADPSILVKLNDPTITYDILAKPQGYLAQKTQTTGSLLSVLVNQETTHSAYFGDFTGNNRIVLGDIVTIIRAFNGEQNLASAAVGGLPTLSNLVTVIRNYNMSPVGDN